jgi:hypothetical protein
VRSKALLALALLLVLSLSLFPGTLNGHASTVGPVTITGPSKVAVNSSFNYSVTVENLFSNYTVVMIPSGYNLTGASPVSATYLIGTGAPANFTIKAPIVPTTMFLFFQVFAKMKGHPYFYNETEKVSVVTFTNLTVKIKNPSSFKITDANVTFNVNGKYVGSEVINISSNSTMNVSYQWLSGPLPTGIYTVSVIISNKIVQIQGGGTYTFRIQSGNPYMGYIYIGIVAFVAIIILVMIIASYYTRKKRPKWKK